MEQRSILITGGAGFIGANAAHRFIQDGWSVTVWDNLSRPGGEKNLSWLRESGSFAFERLDIRHATRVEENLAGRRFDLILHCAGQVAVTSSVANPREDFECNALGTFNLLEGMRRHAPKAMLIYASTNKVYGRMDDLPVVERGGRYEYASQPQGLSERFPLDFYSPYGCSKGAADQYVRDYARIFGLATVCFRQSCIYGQRQFGIEDQGWVAWFIIAHALGRPVTIYGDGRQTRDVLFIDDLIESYQLAYEHRVKTSGQVYNIGGGPANQLSLLELLRFIEQKRGRKSEVRFGDWRPGDQRVFVADITKAKNDFGWQPRHDWQTGGSKLIEWVDANLDLFRQ
jgi:CDP-paratose 2-epimerase